MRIHVGMRCLIKHICITGKISTVDFKQVIMAYILFTNYIVTDLGFLWNCFKIVEGWKTCKITALDNSYISLSLYYLVHKYIIF